MASGDVVFFDIGETLGAVFEGTAPSGLRLETYAYAAPVLQRLQAGGVTLGVISNTGDMAAADVDAMLNRAGILQYFNRELLIYSSVVGLKKDSPAIFELALGRAHRMLGRTAAVFVGESRAERAFAVAGGMRAAPHPLLAEGVLAGGRPIYLLLRVRRDDVARLAGLFDTAGVAPLRRTDVGTNVEIVALATDHAIAPLQAGGVTVEMLPGAADAVGDDLYLLRGLASQTASASFAAFAGDGPKPVRDTPDGLIVALAPHQTIDDFHVGQGHGHNLKLLADPTLLFRRAPAPAFASRAVAAAAFADATLSPEELTTLAATTSEQHFEKALRFVAGMDGRPAAVGGNRHVLAPQINAVTDALVAEFERIGNGAFSVVRHRFEITGRDVHDVHGSPVPQRIELCNVIAELPGESDEIVLVTAHLDSTAAETFHSSYDPRVHDAPGVDDDGSGVAAVLLVAEFMRTIFAGRKPARTLRFALFNAEEQGLIGSGRYARALAAAGTRIAAVFQMDMIAYNSSAPNNFEVHAGTSSDSPVPLDPDVEAASLAVANFLDGIATTLAAAGMSILAPAQILASPDLAAGRSDHASFQERGYAAICVSEDFFPSPGNPADMNPNYHKVSDRVFDAPFGISIARVVCAAALRTAQPVAAPAFAGAAAALAAAAGGSAEEISGHLVSAADGTVVAGAHVALRTSGTHPARTIAEATVAQDGSFALRAPPGLYHVNARAADGAPLASTHETPFAVEPGKPVQLALDARRPPPMSRAEPAGRRAALFSDMTLGAAAVADVTPDDVLDLARAMIDPAAPDPGRSFAAPAGAAHAHDDDDPHRTLCGTARLRKIHRLAELQGYVAPEVVKLQVRDILAMRETGFASQTFTTPNFVINYQTTGPAAVENNLADFEVMDPGSNPPRLLERLPGGTVPAYVRLVGFWLERSLRFYTSPPFSMRNPAANGRLSAFINAAPYGSAESDGFYINNELPAELVCAVAVHELFHMVQFSYEGSGDWLSGILEGGATFAEDTVADLMNRYLDEAGENFNGTGLLADPNQSLFASRARYKSSLFWRYLAEQRSRLVDEPTIGVDTYRRVIEECAEHGYTTDSIKRAIRSLPFDAELCAFGHDSAMGGVPSSSETSFGNFALACYLKDVPGLPDARFGFRENKENIHIDDVVRLVDPTAPTTDTMVQVKRQRGNVNAAGAKLVFQGRVEALASRYFEAAIAADVETVDVQVSAAASFSGLVQVVAIEEGGRVRDIVRSDKGTWRRRLANTLGGQRLSTVAVIISGGEGGGNVQLSIQAAAAMADVMITRWNSESGREYHLDPHGAAWTWVSPDLWFEPAAGGDFAVRARLHNKGSQPAGNVSCVLSYRPGAAPAPDAPWLPILDANGAVQRIEGEQIAAGAAREFSLAWKPASVAPDGIFTLRAEVTSPDDANPDNNTAFSRMGVAPVASDGTPAVAMAPALAARRGAVTAVSRPLASSRLAPGITTGRTPGRAMLHAVPAVAGIRTMTRSSSADDPARRALPGTLVTLSAVTMRLHRPDGSLAPGATTFFVEAHAMSGAALATAAARGSGRTRRFASMTLMNDTALTRPEAGLFASEFWSIERHEAIAAAAETRLTDAARDAVAHITAPLGNGVSLSGLAAWADRIKGRRPGPNDDADTVAFLTEERNRSQPTWHYVDIPCQADGYDRTKYPEFTRDDDVVQMIAAAVRVFTEGSTRFTKLNALRLIVHLVGDVHQPCHVGCSYIDKSTTPAKMVLDPAVAASKHLPDDHGGGHLLLPGSNGNLHGYWDSKIGSMASGDDDDHDHDHDFADGPPEIKAQHVEKLAALAAALPPAPAGFMAPNDPARWAEGWATKSLIAAREAYATLRITGPGGDDKFKVSWDGKPAYDARCKPIADERLASAVRNLADLLNRILV